MKRNIFDKTCSQQEIFKDERYLYPEFIPERLPHRDAEIDTLVAAFNPVLKGRKPVNVALLGPSGVGKTVVARFVLKELEEFTDRAKTVYINCFEANTRQSVLFKIVSFLGAAIPRRGVATDETYALFLESLRKIDFVPIIVLDEVDQLLQDHASKVLYDILRVVEFQKARIGLTVLSNNLSLMASFDERIRSSFAAEQIIFNPYSPQQLKDILRERANFAFHSHALEKEVINVAAAHAAKIGGDCRLAIESLLKAGRLAERANASKVSLKHLKQAFDVVETNPAKKALKHLSKPEKTILKILAAFQPISSGELYQKFNQTAQRKFTERNLRNFIVRLEKLNLIERNLKEFRGKTMMLSLKVSPQLVEDELR